MPKTMPSTRNLIRDPFGPYPEHQILNSQFGKKGCLDLNSVSMECAGSPIGLDDSEFLISGCEGKRSRHDHVHFYGRLEIQSLDWLSDQGRRWLELDLRERDREINFEHALSGLTLASLYGDGKNSGMRVTVWIQGEKSMQARFLVQGHENSLIIHSKASRETSQIGSDSSLAREGQGRNDYIGRMYDIKSLDVGTFERSQNFLTRYRLWALIDDIIATDPRKTPPEDRTIDWLVDSYLARIRKRDARRRLIFHVFNDGDVNEEGDTTKRRYLRHIPRAELFGLFAAHAEWILAQQLATTSSAVRKLNIPSWISFCRRVKSGRRSARSNDLRWGLAYGVDSDGEDGDEIDLSQFGQTREFWSKKIMKKAVPKPVEKSPSYPPERHVTHRQPPKFTYDSDFSEGSTSSTSDTDQDVPYSPDLARRVPPFCMNAPDIPTGRFKWECPGCDYVIDFLSLTEENTKVLPVNLGKSLREKSWLYLNEDRMRYAIQRMISSHYSDHMHKNGVQVVCDKTKCYVTRWP